MKQKWFCEFDRLDIELTHKFGEKNKEVFGVVKQIAYNINFDNPWRWEVREACDWTIGSTILRFGLVEGKRLAKKTAEKELTQILESGEKYPRLIRRAEK